MKINQLLFIFLTVLVIFTFVANAKKGEKKHKCQQDKIQAKIKEIHQKHSSTKKRRNLESDQFVLGLETTPAPIRITASYNSEGVNSAEFLALVEKSVNISIKYLSDVFWVLPEKEAIVVPSEYTDDEATGITSICNVIKENYEDLITKFPDDLIGAGMDNTDLHLIIEYDNNKKENYLAYAAQCQSHHGRATVGLVNFNQAYFDDFHDGSNMAFEHYLEVAIHEIMHVFGFNSDNIPNFLSPDGKKYEETNYIVTNEQKQTLLITPKVSEVAKNHYDCDEIPGAYMENGGGSGSALSHWEQTYLFNEIMNPTAVQSDSVVSDFTLAFFRDSNWYQWVDFGYSETIHWGKDKGCLFFDSCGFDEYESTAEICTFYHFGKGAPLTSQFLNQCPVQLVAQDCQVSIDSDEYPQQDITLESFSEQSKCFKSTFQLQGQDASDVFDTRCYKQECNNAGQIEIKITDKSNVEHTLTCTSDGQVLQAPVGSGLEGKLTCPDDLSLFCEMPIPCPSYCTQNGYCVRQGGEGHCNCIDGFAGDDCSISCDTVLDNTNTCIASCPLGQYEAKGTKKCLDCDSCNHCTGPDAADCQDCPQGQFTDGDNGNQCTATCPQGQFGNVATGLCENCDAKCTNGCLKASNNCIIIPQPGKDTFQVPDNLPEKYDKLIPVVEWNTYETWCPEGEGNCDCSLLNVDCIECSSSSPQCTRCSGDYDPSTNCQNVMTHKSCFENNCCSINSDCVECSSSCLKCNPNWSLGSDCDKAIDESKKYGYFKNSSCYQEDCDHCSKYGICTDADRSSERNCYNCCHISPDCTECVGNTCLQCNPGFDPHYQCMLTLGKEPSYNCGDSDCTCQVFGPDCINCDLNKKICLECADNKDPLNNCRSYLYSYPCEVNGCCNISPFCAECEGGVCKTCRQGFTIESGCTKQYPVPTSVCSGIKDQEEQNECVNKYFQFDCSHVDECYLCFSESIDSSKTCVACKAPYNPLTDCKNSYYEVPCSRHGCCSINENCILCDGSTCLKCNPGYDIDSSCSSKVNDWEAYVYDKSKNSDPPSVTDSSNLLQFTFLGFILYLIFSAF